MPSKIDLLCKFYNTIDTSRIKIETKKYGLSYMRKLKSAAELNYCTCKKDVYKYRLSGLSRELFMDFLDRHLKKELNLCVYFNSEKNSLFAFNLDSHGEDESSLKVYALYLFKTLFDLGIDPLIIKSGHGYHFWCRISEPVGNSKLLRFADAVSDKALHISEQKGLNVDILRCTRYPRINTGDISIRLFGTKHMYTGEFSDIVTRIDIEDTVLGENESWQFFEWYLKECRVPLTVFNKAYERAVRYSNPLTARHGNAIT